MINSALTEASTILGVTDQKSSCDCCGREGLKSVVAIILAGHSEPTYYGSTCATKKHLRMSLSEIKNKALEAKEKELDEITRLYLQHDAAQAVSMAAFTARKKGFKFKAFSDAISPSLQRAALAISEMIETGGYKFMHNVSIIAFQAV